MIDPTLETLRGTTGGKPQPVLPLTTPVAALPVQRPGMQGILTHRTRLGELVRRMSVIGATVGGVLFVLLLILLLWPGVLFDRSSIGYDSGPGNVLGLLSAASFVMSGMLCFYCLRARGTLRKLGPEYLIGLQPADPPAGTKLSQRPMPFLKSDLNKARLMATPMLVCLLLIFAIYRKGLASGGGLISLAVGGACLGCSVELIAVRRSAWEIARIEGASFDALQRRGFAVLAPGGHAAPAPAAGVVPVASAGNVAGETADAFSDWETMLHGISVLGLAVYIFSVPWLFEAGVQFLRSVATRTLHGSESRLLAAIFIDSATAVCWIGWCVTCLAFGPRFRMGALVLAWVSMGAAVLNNMAIFLDSDYGRGNWESPYTRSLAIRIFTTSMVFPVIALLLLRRPPMKQLFSHHPRRRRRGG